MAASGASRRARRRSRKRRFRLGALLPSAQTRRKWLAAFRRAPLPARIVIVTGVLAVVLLGVNWTYQVIRKPSELFFPVSGTLYKTPTETWRAYEPIFRRHSTGMITPELLAALAQVEGSGNPIVRTYWRWSMTSELSEVYRPASSAVGMYQITNGTFDEARELCVHDHVVVEDGPWNAWHTCWFNSLYTRTVPSHAVELTSAYLDRRVTDTLRQARVSMATREQQRDLAALIHLCGAAAGERYARRHFRLSAGQRCGDHDARAYLARVNIMRRVFEELARE